MHVHKEEKRQKSWREVPLVFFSHRRQELLSVGVHNRDRSTECPDVLRQAGSAKAEKSGKGSSHPLVVMDIVGLGVPSLWAPTGTWGVTNSFIYAPAFYPIVFSSSQRIICAPKAGLPIILFCQAKEHKCFCIGAGRHHEYGFC